MQDVICETISTLDMRSVSVLIMSCCLSSSIFLAKQFHDSFPSATGLLQLVPAPAWNAIQKRNCIWNDTYTCTREGSFVSMSYYQELIWGPPFIFSR